MEREWKPQKIKELFDSVIPGKGKGANHLVKAAIGKIPYIGATNRNNGVMFFVEANDNNKTMMQAGNCIGFIKNGDGSAGYAIYREQAFISTNDVIFGYRANNLDKNTGIFLVAAQDMIQKKYSHGYKRNRERLLKDRIMLPITNDKKPDWNYMASFVKAFRLDLIKRYKKYVTKQLSKLEYKDIPALNEMKWNPFIISNEFRILPGTRLVAAHSAEGARPFIGALDNSNGVARFVSDKNASLDKNVLGVNYNGNGMGIGFYHPYECIFTDDVKRFHLKHHEDNKYILLFMKVAILMQKQKFGYLYKFNANRMAHTKILLPVIKGKPDTPDYAYMEQYSKNMMLRKYRQYLSYLTKRE